MSNYLFSVMGTNFTSSEYYEHNLKLSSLLHFLLVQCSRIYLTVFVFLCRVKSDGSVLLAAKETQATEYDIELMLGH